MTRLQLAFLLFSVFFLLVKLGFFIIEYQIMTNVAKRASAKKRFKEKIIDFATIQNEERHPSKLPGTEKTAKEEIKVC